MSDVPRPEDTLLREACAFVAHYTANGGCGHCGGLPHTTGCYVGRIARGIVELEALSTPPVSQEWQPIEDAPEGTMCLFCSMETFEVREWCFVDWRAGGKFILHPTWSGTHFMSLPAPPRPSEKT